MSWIILTKLNTIVFITVRGKKIVKISFLFENSSENLRTFHRVFISIPRTVIPKFG
jgi:hypothetical protein